MAPEVLKDEGYDGTLADVWSCGVILFFILTGRKPFDNDDYKTEQIVEMIKMGCYKFEDSDKISDEAKDLISKILQPNPKKRYFLQDIKEHKWFLENIDAESETLYFDYKDEQSDQLEIQKLLISEKKATLYQGKKSTFKNNDNFSSYLISVDSPFK